MPRIFRETEPEGESWDAIPGTWDSVPGNFDDGGAEPIITTRIFAPPADQEAT